MKIFHNCLVYTMDSEADVYTAFSVKGSKIEALYRQKPEIEGEYIDLAGCFVFPGFIDTHTHCSSGGIYSSGVSLENCRNLSELKARLAEGNLQSNMLFAWHLDENQLAEKRFPTAEELDSLYPNAPVLVRRVDGHSCIINTKAAAQIQGIRKAGVFRARDNDFIVNWFHNQLDDEGILTAYEKAAAHAVKYGHTTVHTMVGDGYNSLEHYKLLQENLDRFPIEFILYAQCFNLEAAREAGAKRLGGCILADGSFGSHTAALFEPYSDEPDNFGKLYHNDKFWEEFIMKAHAAGLGVAVHCIGDRAISQVLKYYCQVQQEQPKDLRHMLIHNELISDEMIRKTAENNIVAAMQPMFDHLWAGKDGLYEHVLGKKRTKSTNRLRSLTDAGVIIGGGSDWYVTEMDALAEMEAAVKMHNEKERLSVFEAIKLYTRNAAWLSYDENRLGQLKEGFQADFVVLEENPLMVENIGKIRINSVYKKGNRIEN